MRRLIDEDRGSATVVGAWAIAALTLVLAGVVYFGAATIARHSAQSTADLSALAGAGAHLAGDDACTRAAEVARRQPNGPRLIRCGVVDDDVTVDVGVPVVLGRWGVREAVASARAGPVDQP